MSDKIRLQDTPILTNIWVSVIVPVYRAKRYLPELLTALCSQTLREMEFIFVNDRGGDGSFNVVKEAAKNDPRIVCLENRGHKGPGFSRNKGIRRAKGKYIAFADADDTMAPDFYELLYRKAEEGNYLVVKGRRCKLLPDGKIEQSPLNDTIRSRMERAETAMCLFTYEHQSGLFCRQVVLESKAQNAENSRYDEDTCFLMMVLRHVPIARFGLEDEARYFYRQHGESLVQQKRDAYFLQQSNNSAEFKIDYLLQHSGPMDCVQFLSSTFEERLGARLDAAEVDGVEDADAHEYVQLLADKLREWKKDTTLPYKPGVLASALEEENYRAARFYMLRKVYKKLALSNQKADAIRRDLESVRRELAISTKSQKQTEQALSTTRQEAAEQGARLEQTELALAAAREEAAEQGARLEQALVTAGQVAAEQGAKLAQTEQALVTAGQAAAEQSARLAQTEQALVAAREEAAEQGARLEQTEQALTVARKEAAEQGARLAQTEQALADAREKATEQGARLARTEQALAAAREEAAEQGARLERALASAREELAELARIQQMMAMKSRLRWRYQLLRIKKVFCFGAAKKRAVNELREARRRVHDYRVVLKKMKY